MSLLDQEDWHVTVQSWMAHRDNHRIMSDPVCVFCDDDPRWKPGRKWTNETRAKGEQ